MADALAELGASVHLAHPLPSAFAARIGSATRVLARRGLIEAARAEPVKIVV
ncbi:MAG TPA: hypothetical protein VE645_19350 [Pseudonocardiaceae bacterium]|nr:hypothetical protein [Pseudonocardiaceae bacterium]